MANTQARLNKQGQNHIQQLQQAIKSLWKTMCQADGIPADSKFVVFSEETLKKYGTFYNNALTQFSEAVSQYHAGGYVGLQIVNGKAQ